jgi:hypothetical protein
MSEHSKTKTSFYRRLYVAFLIDTGTNTVPAITQQTGMPRRTAQDTIAALKELDIDCVFSGGNKNGSYNINSWGAINRDWIKTNLAQIQQVLGLE